MSPRWKQNLKSTGGMLMLWLAASAAAHAQSPAPAQSLPAQGLATAVTQAAEAATPETLAPPQSEIVSNSVLTERRAALPPMLVPARLGVQAGESHPLTLNEAVQLALENNNDIGLAKIEVRQAETLLRSLQGAYDPVFQLTPQLSSSVTPQATSLGGSDTSGTTSTTSLSFNQSLFKRFSRSGASYEFFFNNNRSATSSSFNLLSPVYSTSFGFTVAQPLWRDRSIDRTRRDIRVQRKRLEQSDADFRQRTIEIIAQVQRAYWDLVFALRDQQNQVDNLNLARDNFRRIETAITAGSSAPLERAEVQTELSNRQEALLVSTQNVSVAENSLRALILRDRLAQEWSVALVPTDEPSFDEIPVNLNDALTAARANRPELRHLRLQHDINDIEVSFLKNQAKPRIDLLATISSTGLAGKVVDGEAGVPSNLTGDYLRSLRNAASLSTRNVAVGVTIQLPLKNRTAEANLAYAKLEEEKVALSTRSREQSIEIEVRNAAQAAEIARQRVLVTRVERQAAEQQVEGERKLYEIGRSTTFLLFQRQNQLVEARNHELRALIDYNKALADLQHSTSMTLAANSVVLDSTTAP